MDNNQLNFYCDESCHLEHDKSRYMVLGTVYGPQSSIKSINKEIIALKKKYSINESIETKWSKLSKSRYAYYEELINYFFKPDTEVSFNAIVVDKKKLKHTEFNQTHNEFYYKIMYLMLNYRIIPFWNNKIYVDEKDTHNAERVRILEKILKNNFKDYYWDVIKPIQVIKSHEIQIMQLTDILTGAISYCLNNKELKNNSKVEIIKLIEKKIGKKLKSKQNIGSTKFDVMYFRCKEQYHG